MKNSNLKALFLFLMLAAAAPLFAQVPTGMQTMADNILEIFTGGFAKAIMMICLCGCAIAYAYNKDNDQMKKKILAVGIAIFILVGVQWITDWIWQAGS